MEDTSPENLRKFLESDDPAMVTMGLSMAKGIGVHEEILPTILKLYMWNNDKTIRSTAKSFFTKWAPNEIQVKLKKNWKASYRTLSIAGEKFRENACQFLEAFKYQDEFAVIVLEPLIKDPANFTRQLEKIGSKLAVEPTIKALENKELSNYSTMNLIVLLAKIGNKLAVEPLIKFLEDKRPSVCNHATYYLGEIGDLRAVEPLIQALEDKEGYSRHSAANALGKIGDKRAFEPLIKALEDEDKDVLEPVAEALGKFGDKRAVEPLIKALEDSNYPWAATVALGKIGDKRAVEPLIKALEDRNLWFSGHIAIALGEIGDKRAVEPLIKALKDGNTSWRGTAIMALGKIGDKRAVEPLIKALGNNWTLSTREEAASALANIGDKRAVEPLIKTLEDDDENICNAAAEALGEIGGKRAVEGLIEALNVRAAGKVRKTGYKSLINIAKKNIRGKEKDNVMKFLKSKDTAMVMMGASMLKGILEE